MSYPSLAIIGTAGRKEDKQYLTAMHYERMIQSVILLMDYLKVEHQSVKLISGGAAWADHLVVSMALLEIVRPENVTVFLPTDLTDGGFMGGDEKSQKTADTAMWYHRSFSHVIGRNTVQELRDLRDRGGILHPGKGNFFERNSSVAKSVTPDGVLVAYTFGDPEGSQPPWTLRQFDAETKADVAGLKDGGTADTFNKARCFKWHAKIGKTL